MSLNNIQFKKMKKIHGHYIERAHLNNTIIQFKITDLSIQKTLYKKDKKIMLDFSMEKDNQRVRRLNKLKNYTIKRICEKHEVSFEDMEQNYINYAIINEDSITMTLEIHPECKFTKIDSFDVKTEDSYKNLNINDTIDILVSFKGILYGKSTFTNKYVIHKVIRHEIQELKLEELNIDIDSESEDEDDEEVYSKKYKNRFSDFFPTPEEVKPIPVIEEIKKEIIFVDSSDDNTIEETIIPEEIVITEETATTESIAETQIV